MLERERDEAKRASNVVTFASVCRPLATLLGSRNDPARWHRVERLVDRLLSGASDEDITVYRIQQSELDAAESWRVPLKAPEIFGRYSQLPNVKRLDEPFEIGVAPILGDKRWFVVSDVSDSVSDAELKEHGVERQSVIGGTRRYRFVEGALGWRGPIESRFLARAVRGPKAQPRRVLSSEDGNLVVMIPESAQLRGLKVLDYIRWGETHKINEGAYVAARSKWYCLEDRPKAPIIMPHAAQFAWKVWENPHRKLYTTRPNSYLTPRGTVSEHSALAVLNSTWTFLAATMAAGDVGVEGAMRFGGRTQFVRLLTVDPRAATSGQSERLATLWRELRSKEVHDFPPAGNESLSGWRRELDELVALVGGADDAVDASELVDQLYGWLRDYIGNREGVESIAVAGRRDRTRRSGRAGQLAQQAVAATGIEWPWNMDDVGPDWQFVSPPAQAVADDQYSLFGAGGFSQKPTDVQFGDSWMRFRTDAEADIVRILARADLLPARIVIMGSADAPEWREKIRAFVNSIADRVRDQLNERIAPDDPAYPDAFVRALSLVTNKLRDDAMRVADMAAEAIPSLTRPEIMAPD